MSSKKVYYDANNRYIKNKTRSFIFRLKREEDADLIAFLDAQDNKTKTFRDALHMFMCDDLIGCRHE